MVQQFSLAVPPASHELYIYVRRSPPCNAIFAIRFVIYCCKREWRPCQWQAYSPVCNEFAGCLDCASRQSCRRFSLCDSACLYGRAKVWRIASHRSRIARPGFGETTADGYPTLSTGHEASVWWSGTLSGRGRTRR